MRKCSKQYFHFRVRVRVRKQYSRVFSSAGKVVFGECACAALALDGSRYFDKSWLNAAAPVTSTPLRINPSPAPCLINLLARFASLCLNIVFVFFLAYLLRNINFLMQ
jgi:hypothetical protein